MAEARPVRPEARDPIGLAPRHHRRSGSPGPAPAAVWRGLPASPWGYTQKTVWWSELWDPGAEPEPEIYVSGERLDAPGTFRFGPGTNATAPDIATAMMVGIDVPELGCWRVTATYRDASLSYTVLVAAD